jgi:predicted nuclease of predicted toxin-antitoxin system
VAPKLVLDENLSPSVAHRLAALGYDVTCLRDRGLLGGDDWDLMAWCEGEGRAICTQNIRHFEREHERYQASARVHFGIVTVEDWTTERIFRALKAFLERTRDIDLLNELLPLEEP